MVALRIDTLKAVITYTTAAILVIGGALAIVFVEMPPDKLAIISAIVGGGSVFLFGQETATRTTRQTLAAVGNGHREATKTEGM